MAEEPTCGQGLAQHAELPLLVGELMGAVADNLGAHLPGLVSSDEDSRHEKRVYGHLVTRHRQAAAMLHAIGAEMVGHREMPMGEHDPQALSSGEVVDTLEAGLVDALILHQVPVLLGAGRPYFQELPEHVQLRLIEVVPAPGVTHLHYAVER